MKPNFFSNFFVDEIVAQEPAQLLAETWCPYLLWVLRNLPHKFEKLAHVTKSAKKKRHHMGILAPLVPQKLNANNKAPRFARRLKNVTIWASRSARAPKTYFSASKLLFRIQIFAPIFTSWLRAD